MLRKLFWMWLTFGAWLAIILSGIFLVFNLMKEASQFQSKRNSVELNVTVIDVEQRFQEGFGTFRPLFAVIDADGTQVEYAGNSWVFPKPHEIGDVVAGRYNASTGEIHSDSMDQVSQSFDRVFLVNHFVIMLSGIIFLIWRKRRRTASKSK